MSQYFHHFNRKLRIINFKLQWYKNHNIALEADLKGQVWQHKCKCSLPAWGGRECLQSPSTFYTFRLSWKMQLICGRWQKYALCHCSWEYAVILVYSIIHNTTNGQTVELQLSCSRLSLRQGSPGLSFSMFLISPGDVWSKRERRGKAHEKVQSAFLLPPNRESPTHFRFPTVAQALVHSKQMSSEGV